MMRKVCKNKNVNSRLIILIVALAIAVMAGFGTAAYAAGSDAGMLLQDDRGIFDPFTMSTVFISVSESDADASVSSIVTRPPIRIPVRPALRSYFRPPLVQVP